MFKFEPETSKSIILRSAGVLIGGVANWPAGSTYQLNPGACVLLRSTVDGSLKWSKSVCFKFHRDGGIQFDRQKYTPDVQLPVDVLFLVARLCPELYCNLVLLGEQDR